MWVLHTVPQFMLHPFNIKKTRLIGIPPDSINYSDLYRFLSQIIVDVNYFIKKYFNFSSQVMLNDVHNHKYHHHHHWQISCKSVTVATRQRYPSYAIIKSEWRPIFSGARSFTMFRVKVIPGRPFGLFHSGCSFLIAASKTLQQSSSGGSSGNVTE